MPVRLRSLTFRMQIALTFGAIVVVLIASLSTVLGRLEAETIRDNASRSLQVVANNAQRILALGLHQRMLIVEGLVNSESLWANGLDSPEVRTAFAQQQATRSHLAWLGAADRNGVVRAATGGLLVGADVTARPWFAAGLRGRHVGDVHQALLLAKLLPPSSTGEPQRFVDFAAPIRIDGEIRGVLAMHGSWDWVRGVLETQLPDEAQQLSIDLFILDRNGSVIYAPASVTGASVRVGDDLKSSATQVTQTGSVVRWPDTHEYLTSAATLRTQDVEEDLGWVVVARTPKDVAYAPVRAAIAHIALMGLVAMAIAMVLAWVVAGSICKPLSAIQRAAGEVVSGQVGATLPMYSGNVELEGLSTALIGMTRELETRIREHTELARFDALTQLLNRRGFDEAMEVAVASAKRRFSALSVIAIDIDHFKSVNDRYGHDTGDAVLKLLALLMKDWFRESDIIGRMGGEEFTVLLVDTDLASAHRVAEQLVQHVAATTFPDVGTITISCGVSKLRAAEEGYVTLKRADRALYRAKTDGRNRTVMLATEVEA